jgi:hypothetical protein
MKDQKILQNNSIKPEGTDYLLPEIKFKFIELFGGENCAFEF